MAKYKKYPFIMNVIIKKYMKEKCIHNKKEILFKTQKYYKDFVLEAPDLGGSKNVMSYNLYYALAFFAFYEALDKSFTKEEFYLFLEKYFSKPIPILSFIFNFNHKSIQRILKKQIKKYKVLSEKRNWNNTWKIEINHDIKEDGLAVNLLSCPIADFAIKHNYTEIMPVLCKMDFLTAKLMHAKLIRKHTIIEDHKPCDYLYIPDKTN